MFRVEKVVSRSQRKTTEIIGRVCGTGAFAFLRVYRGFSTGVQPQL